MFKAFTGLAKGLGKVDDLADGAKALGKVDDAVDAVKAGERAVDAGSDAKKGLTFGQKVLAGMGLVGTGVVVNEGIEATTGSRGTEHISDGITDIGDDINSALGSLLYDVIIPGFLIYVFFRIATKT